jgi:hypothetical protein
MHLRLRELEIEGEAEVAELALREQVGAYRNCVLVATDDFLSFNRPVFILVPDPNR